MAVTVDELVQRLWPHREANYRSLPGGITNANYFVDLGEEQVVLRIAGDHTELLGIDRHQEVASGELAASLGVAPEVLDRSETEGWMVTRFLAGRPIPPEELGAEPMLGRVATTLRRLHSAGTVEAHFNTHVIVREYHEVAHAKGVVEPFDYESAVAVLDRIGKVRPFAPSCFCHNDLLNGNFLFDGAVRILDWEYAGMGDPFFDLANLSVNHHFSPEADERLIAHYFGRPDEPLAATLALTKLVSELREAMWGVVQLAVSSLDVDFAAYCKERSDHFEALLADLDLAATLEKAARVTPEARATE